MGSAWKDTGPHKVFYHESLACLNFESFTDQERALLLKHLPFGDFPLATLSEIGLKKSDQAAKAGWILMRVPASNGSSTSAGRWLSDARAREALEHCNRQDEALERAAREIKQSREAELDTIRADNREAFARALKSRPAWKLGAKAEVGYAIGPRPRGCSFDVGQISLASPGEAFEGGRPPVFESAKLLLRIDPPRGKALLSELLLAPSERAMASRLRGAEKVLELTEAALALARAHPREPSAWEGSLSLALSACKSASAPARACLDGLEAFEAEARLALEAARDWNEASALLREGPDGYDRPTLPRFERTRPRRLAEHLRESRPQTYARMRWGSAEQALAFFFFFFFFFLGRDPNTAGARRSLSQTPQESDEPHDRTDAPFDEEREADLEFFLRCSPMGREEALATIKALLRTPAYDWFWRIRRDERHAWAAREAPELAALLILERDSGLSELSRLARAGVEESTLICCAREAAKIAARKLAQERDLAPERTPARKRLPDAMSRIFDKGAGTWCYACAHGALGGDTGKPAVHALADSTRASRDAVELGMELAQAMEAEGLQGCAANYREFLRANARRASSKTLAILERLLLRELPQDSGASSEGKSGRRRL